MKSHQFITFGSLSSILVFGVALASSSCVSAQAKNKRTPDAPDTIKAPAGNKVHFRVLAEGVQIYSWNASNWMLVAPEAKLFDPEGNIVGRHYTGPTWESSSGSKVVAARVAGVPSTRSNSIPQLLLKAQTAEGPGIFDRTTYVQRVNTVGGVAPLAPGTSAGQQARVPYTAEYFFYRATK